MWKGSDLHSLHALSLPSTTLRASCFSVLRIPAVRVRRRAHRTQMCFPPAVHPTHLATAGSLVAPQNPPLGTPVSLSHLLPCSVLDFLIFTCSEAGRSMFR